MGWCEMPRLLTTLKSRSAFTYDNTTNHKAQGRVYADLERAGFKHLHDKTGPKLFAFTLPFPNRGGDEGDERWFMFTAQNPTIVSGVKDSLEDNREFNIGEMPFHVEHIQYLNPKVGERGVLETSTPILIRVDQERVQNKFGIETEYDSTHWTNELGTDVFFHRVRENLQRKYRTAFGEKPPEPPYFTNYRFNGTYSKPVTFPNGDQVFLLSEWSFEYAVRGADHRKILNLALNSGIGELCSLGFGVMNLEAGERLADAGNAALPSVDTEELQSVRSGGSV